MVGDEISRVRSQHIRGIPLKKVCAVKTVWSISTLQGQLHSREAPYSMKATFHIDIFGQLDDGHLGFARLECELHFAPSVDIEFEHPVWHDTRKPKAISYNLDDGSFYIVFDHEVVESKNQLDRLKAIYEHHGWMLS